MSTISGIEPGRRKGRFNIYVEGEFAVAVGERTLADLMLRVGQPFDPERLREIAGAEEARKALDSAMRLIELRARSRREIEQRLQEKGYEPETIAGAVATLARIGALDDADFARQWVESRSRAQPKGARMLRSELAQKGIAKGEIEEAVAHVTPDAEAEMARRALAPKIGRRALPEGKLERRAEYQRLAAFLQRRGFGWDSVKIALGEAFRQDKADETPDEELAGDERLGAGDDDEPRLGSLDGAGDDDSETPATRQAGRGRQSRSAADEPFERRLGAMDDDASVERPPARRRANPIDVESA